MTRRRLGKKEKENKKQRIYNNIGILLVIGIIGGTGLLLVKYSEDKKEPIKIIEPSQEERTKNAEIKGAQISSKININTATLEELDKLQGIGPATAQKIIDWRTQNGNFKSIEELMNVSGIGEGKFENIKDKVSI